MDSYDKISVGMIVRNHVSREVGIIKKIISVENSTYCIVIVKTRTGRKKWKLKISQKTFIQKILSLFTLK